MPNSFRLLISRIRRKEDLKFTKDGSPKLDKNGIQKKRILYPSLGRLKVIQRRINKTVLAKLCLPDYAYGAVKNRDNVMNARKHQGKKFNFTTDLTAFYPSINHHMVNEMFLSFKFSPTVARILTQLTTYKGMIPQGAPTSSAVANLVFIKTGKKLQQFAVENGITFTSFVDDLTFSAPVDFKDKTQAFIDALVSDGYRISHSKTSYKTKNPVVTGVVVKNNKLDLTDGFKIKLTQLEGRTPEQIKGLFLYKEKVTNA